MAKLRVTVHTGGYEKHKKNCDFSTPLFAQKVVHGAGPAVMGGYWLLAMCVQWLMRVPVGGVFRSVVHRPGSGTPTGEHRVHINKKAAGVIPPLFFVAAYLSVWKRQVGTVL
jgi:hypothetical protein